MSNSFTIPFHQFLEDIETMKYSCCYLKAMKYETNKSILSNVTSILGMYPIVKDKIPSFAKKYALENNIKEYDEDVISYVSSTPMLAFKDGTDNPAILNKYKRTLYVNAVLAMFTLNHLMH